MEKSNHKSKIWLRTAMVFLFAVVVTVFSKMDVKAAISGAPSGVHQTEARSGSISFSWENGYSDIGAEINYVWEISMNQAFTQINQIGHESYNTYDNAYGLGAGKTFYVRVGATEQEVYGIKNTTQIPKDIKWSNAVQMVTAPSSKIEGFKQTKTSTTSMTVSWKKNASANEYQIRYQKKGSNSYTTKYTTATSYTLKNLKAGTNYYVEVSAVRKASGFRAVSSNESYGYFKTISGKVKGLENIGVSNKSAHFAWDQLDNVDGYQISMTTYGEKKWKKVIKTKNANEYSSSMYLDSTKIKLGKFYRAHIRSYVKLSDGTPKYSAWSSDIVFGSSPKSVVAKKSGRNVKISWSKVNGATGYVVYVSTSSNKGYKKVATLKSNTRKYTLKKFNKKALKYGSDYYVRVEPIKKDGKKLYHTYFDYYSAYQDSVWLTKW